jgi:hypothetical protein
MVDQKQADDLLRHAERLERAVKFMDRPHSPAANEVRTVASALRQLGEASKRLTPTASQGGS